MRKKLVVSGCSFTDKNYYIVTDNEEHHCLTWGEILAKDPYGSEKNQVDQGSVR